VVVKQQIVVVTSSRSRVAGSAGTSVELAGYGDELFCGGSGAAPTFSGQQVVLHTPILSCHLVIVMSQPTSLPATL
jgi:hypothetical protein